MRDELLTLIQMRRKFSSAKNDMVSDSVCVGVYATGRFGGFGIGMHADVREVLAKARFHERASGRVERLPGRAKRFEHR